MAPHVTRLADAFSLLGLSEGCTFDELKTAYKQHALRTHPDKNPGNMDATAEFQRVGEAYKIIERHLEKPRFTSNDYYSGDFFMEVDVEDIENYTDEYSDSDYDYSDDDYDSDWEGGYYRVPRSFMEFLSLYEAINNGHYPRDYPEHRREPPYEFSARVKRSREEQVAAEARRATATAIKEQKVRDRERERTDAERRQKDKAKRKKAQAEAERKRAQGIIRSRHQHTQELRSAVFAAARSGDVNQVKNGIWKNGVDAAGGEVQYEEFVISIPKDPLETLLHITAKAGRTTLFEWLDAHNAELDEQNSQGYTPLHVALYHGQIQIVKHVLENYSPKEQEHKTIYYTPACEDLLFLAIKSGEPELVWMILDNGLFTPQDINLGWSIASQAVSAKKGTTEDKNGRASDILKLVERYGGSSPPSVAPVVMNSQGDRHDAFRTQTKWTWEGRGRGRGAHQRSARFDQDKAEGGYEKQDQTFKARRGYGRGDGRGRGWGDSRGRGRGQGHTRLT